ncbi:DUF1361 domain-containing protein [Lentilactobacillus parakefiri]|uniref:Membrane protein n=1 Tax=Lentilactobacillus parakefiri TaxID=152332 RepID=A0A224VFT3_9LACO|nr:DUF1361 domain-containing protein [Lentilactobacillus parakefiri]KRL58309.1 hypothetical protein FD08_GL003584 [Lentilactobacillus parakefiri DSM 10551]TDG94105.1 hypothetical protein C5L28_001319 [Lentilactobacillus parakefiri]GAW71194.1 membrane protein [Lentilactobacillus parakefiri]
MNAKTKWLIRGLFLVWIALLYSYLKQPPFNFLVLNTFLAFIPIELSFHIDVGQPKNGLLFWVLIIIWLLFYPNTPYLLTDLFHLSLLNPYGVNGLLRLDDLMWFKFALLLISTIFSTLIGLWGLDKVAEAITARIHAHHFLAKHVVIVLLTVLASIGIFIGRFLRIHTIYLFLTPELFIRPLLNMWSRPAVIFIILLTAVQLVFYYTLKLIQKPQTK